MRAAAERAAAPPPAPATVLGLTGGIGMGKSTTAAMFAEAGVPVWDADAAVARLYAPGGAAVAPLAAAFPDAVREGAVDKGALRARIAADPAILERLNAIVHPLVAEDRAAFLEGRAGPAGHDALVLLDVPLLFETGLDAACDKTAVVSVDAATQRARVLARGTMTEEELAAILSRQMPDVEKRARADYVIPTDTMEGARAAVAAILEELGHHA